MAEDGCAHRRRMALCVELDEDRQHISPTVLGD